jgi:hypothetical protein
VILMVIAFALLYIVVIMTETTTESIASLDCWPFWSSSAVQLGRVSEQDAATATASI